MRYFKYYADDTLRPLNIHGSGYLVDRKPLVFSFEKNRPKRKSRRVMASIRMGKAFVKRLTKEGSIWKL